MRELFGIIVFVSTLWYAISVVAANRVVVIPLAINCIETEGNCCDCNGDPDGIAYLDLCNICVGGNTGISPCYEEVTSNGQIWLDRNLGASRVATSIADSHAYGDLYQWGRLTDGHEKRNSDITTTTSGNNVPGHSNFIISSGYPIYDWRIPQNNNLWQGVGGINNPCPLGFRLPTIMEWEIEMQLWDSNDPAASAFASPLKLPAAGVRNGNNDFSGEGWNGNYWSSTVSDKWAHRIGFNSDNITTNATSRDGAHSIRCIKN